jgi:uncharacterized repeat protein (TIGR04052 family)
VHDVRVRDAEGRWAAAQIVDDGRHQSTAIALVDLVAATTGCRDGRSGHATIRLDVPAGTWRAIAFRVGVPFALDHADPATSTAPLTIGEMHWGWQAGFKHLRVEGDRDGAPFRVHLGATGCEGTFTHVTRCVREDVAEVEIDDVDVGRSAIAFDLAALVGVRATSCMGGDDASCATAFDALGLDLDRGAPTHAAKAFHAR